MKIFTMKRLGTLLLFAAMPAIATAQGLPQLAPGEVLVSVGGVAVQPGATSYSAAPLPAMPSVVPYSAPVTRTSLAQSKANRMANSGMMGHLGGGFGGGHAEGVGTGSTREAAIRNCCYWGRRTPIDIGTATNGRRWFACVIYR